MADDSLILKIGKLEAHVEALIEQQKKQSEQIADILEAMNRSKGMATAGVLLGYLWIVFCCFFFLPFQFGVGTLLVISLLFAIYGMLVLTRNEKTEPLGILATILGWLGFMASIFLLFDYQ